jgi:hypothetical protein
MRNTISSTQKLDQISILIPSQILALLLTFNGLVMSKKDKLPEIWQEETFFDCSVFSILV